MTDEELVRGFEDLTLPPGAFTHAAHVRVGWWYLRSLPLGTALERFSSALKRYAAHLGAAGKYHETITVTYMLLIAERLHDARELPWEAFAARFPELLARAPSLVETFYSPARLAGERARTGFVTPDRCPHNSTGSGDR
jgi:hypothetical protein